MQFQFESLSDFLSMGNYGFYVWLSYAVSIIAMGGLIWFSRREEKQLCNKSKRVSTRSTTQ
ncbi:heme exporter protein D [Actinobacillus equuli]|nr:heme exporter protein D [Actinobacillus equuli]